MSVSPLGWAVLVFALVAAGVALLVLATTSRKREAAARLAEVTAQLCAAGPSAAGSGRGRPLSWRGTFRWMLDRLPRRPPASAGGVRIGQLLQRAGFAGSDHFRLFQLARLCVGLSAAAASTVLAGLATGSAASSLVFGLGGGLAAAALPGRWLRKRGAQRQRTIERELAEVLDLLVVCFEAGLGVGEGIKVVGQEMATQNQALGQELAIVTAELKTGVQLGEALRTMAERCGVDELRTLAATLAQSDELGAQVGPTLRAIAEALRAQRRSRAEEAAQRMPVKILFPLALFVLPAMLLLVAGPAAIQALRALRP